MTIGLGTRIAFAAKVAAVAVALTATAAPQALSQTSRLDEVLKRDKLIVSTLTTNPPFAYTDEKGALVGFDIDMSRLIAKGLLGDENKVEFVSVTSEGRWPAVLSGKVDFGVGGTTVYPDRAVRVAFSYPYIDSGISIMVRKDAGIDSLEALNNEKFTVANLSNPQMAERQKRILPKSKSMTFDTPSAMFLAIKSGQAQAMQMDTPTLDWYAANNGELKVLPEPLAGVQNNAIYMKPGDFTFWLYLSTVVQELRTGSRYNEYAALHKKWFGKNPPPQKFYIK